jgi:hypothetical protein
MKLPNHILSNLLNSGENTRNYYYSQNLIAEENNVQKYLQKSLDKINKAEKNLKWTNGNEKKQPGTIPKKHLPLSKNIK